VTWKVGHEFPVESYAVTRADLVRYAGASGDFNPIHWSDRVATAVGLPGVVAHGMLTMALAGRALSGWVGGPERVVSFATRFTSPVVVPDTDDGTDVQVSAVVKAVGPDTATIELTVTSGAQRVMGATRAVVRC
jgi:acyl dehydratase